mgnify:CR=1 FL=1
MTTNNIILTSPEIPNFVTTVSVNPTDCGASDGSIFVIGTGSSIEYSIDSGSTWTTNNVFDNLSSGDYRIFVRNFNASCETYGGLETIVGSEAAIITGITANQQSDCGINNAFIIIDAIPSGTNTLEYSIDGGVTWQLSKTFNNLSFGTFNISVRNSDNTCQVNEPNPIVLDSLLGPSFSNVNFTQPTDCNSSDGTIEIFTVGSGFYEFSIDGGVTWQSKVRKGFTLLC